MKEMLKKLIEVVELHEEMKDAYFFGAIQGAQARRRYEEEKSLYLDEVILGKQVVVDLRTECSCKNVYYHSTIYVDGKRKDIRAIKKLIKELKIEIEK